MNDRQQYDLLGLMLDMFDGTLPQDEATQLIDRMAVDAEAFKFYMRIVRMDVGLEWSYGKRPPQQVVANELAVLTLRAEDKPTNTTRMPAASLSRSLSRLSRPALQSAALVALCVYGVFLLVAWNLRPDKLPRGLSPFAQPAEEIGSDPLSSSVAVVRDTTDLQWSKVGFAKRTKSTILSGEPLKIESGTIELELGAGAEVLIEGPAEWSVDGRNSVSLRAGKLMAHVPEQAIGFTVETPITEIVDLGTEFGVEVDATGQTDVQVLKGAVNVNYRVQENGSKSPRRSLRMMSGSAKRFSARPGTTAEITVSEVDAWLGKTASATEPTESRQNLSDETRYVASVLADRPLGYWRLSDRGADTAADASGHGNVGKYERFVSSNNPGICPGTNDRSVRFLGPTYKGAIKFTDVELPASFSIELWARSTTPAWNAQGWLFSSRAADGVILYASKGDREWHFAMTDHRGANRLIGTHRPLDIADCFHHYVATYDANSDQGQMYFDSKLVGTKNKVLGDEQRRATTRLTFYVGRDDQDLPNVWGEGSVDELAIYEGALPAAAIQRHFEAAEITKANIEAASSPTIKK